MTELFVQAGSVRLWTERIGDPASPVLLLIMGATSQGIRWPEEFCQRLADGGRCVIRFDNRDTGQSTSVDFARSPYTLHDMAADAVAILDAYGCAAAHVVGISMGGMIGQILALAYRDRVHTLTSFASSPCSASVAVASATGQSAPGSSLPGPDHDTWTAITDFNATVPTTREELIEHNLALRRHIGGTLAPFDEPFFRNLEERTLQRATNLAAAQNHILAIAATPDRNEDLRTITVPTLVIHGTADRLVPVAHGEATAKAIPHAELFPIPGLGHELIPAAYDYIVPALLRHTAVT